MSADASWSVDYRETGRPGSFYVAARAHLMKAEDCREMAETLQRMAEVLERTERVR